ncbi:18725_t:CDS:2, partial [Racocetra fulgida]
MHPQTQANQPTIHTALEITTWLLMLISPTLMKAQGSSKMLSNEQVNMTNKGHNHKFNSTSLQHPNKQYNSSTNQQDNCPLTSLLNNLLINPKDTTAQDETHKAAQSASQSSTIIRLKSNHQKFLSVEYAEEENLLPVQ